MPNKKEEGTITGRSTIPLAVVVAFIFFVDTICKANKLHGIVENSQDPTDDNQITIENRDYKNIELKEDGSLIAYKDAIASNANGTIVYSAPNGYTYCGDGTCFKVLGRVGENIAIIDDGQAEIIINPVQIADDKLGCPENTEGFVLDVDGKLHKIVFVAVDCGLLLYDNLGNPIDVIRTPQAVDIAEQIIGNYALALERTNG